MSSTKIATDGTFDEEVLRHSKPVLVDFYADWCGPCRAVSPVLDQIARAHSESISVVKLNIDENPATVERYDISSVPTMLVFDHGEVVKRIIGARPKPVIETELVDFIH
ncbi:thioredoxin [Mycolicibacterium sp. BiH015]|uniref:thioredoxin n=1 Tax=Mycolicibacterium sp. BiH015 TaxID=3018808 RepID=UPI0022DEA53F|nr:thioredoxin [Mycolicibacterium sp. BiH015]MDA2893449.1 thioredoxin [Mycolicibacterium sp. BiH015]